MKYTIYPKSIHSKSLLILLASKHISKIEMKDSHHCLFCLATIIWYKGQNLVEGVYMSSRFKCMKVQITCSCTKKVNWYISYNFIIYQRQSWQCFPHTCCARWWVPRSPCRSCSCCAESFAPTRMRSPGSRRHHHHSRCLYPRCTRRRPWSWRRARCPPLPPRGSPRRDGSRPSWLWWYPRVDFKGLWKYTGYVAFSYFPSKKQRGLSLRIKLLNDFPIPN